MGNQFRVNMAFQIYRRFNKRYWDNCVDIQKKVKFNPNPFFYTKINTHWINGLNGK